MGLWDQRVKQHQGNNYTQEQQHIKPPVLDTLVSTPQDSIPQEQRVDPPGLATDIPRNATSLIPDTTPQELSQFPSTNDFMVPSLDQTSAASDSSMSTSDSLSDVPPLMERSLEDIDTEPINIQTRSSQLNKVGPNQHNQSNAPSTPVSVPTTDDVIARSVEYPTPSSVLYDDVPSLEADVKRGAERVQSRDHRMASASQAIRERQEREAQIAYSLQELMERIPNFRALDAWVRSAITQEYGKERNSEKRQDDEKTVKEFIYAATKRKMANDGTPMDEPTLQSWTKYIYDDVRGLSVLQDLLDDSTITEIMVVKENKVFVERRGRLEKTNIAFRDKAHVKDLIDRIIAPLGREINESQPNVDGRLPNRSRVSASIPPIAIDGPTLTIRKFPEHGWKMDDLLRNGSIDELGVYLLEYIVKAKQNTFVSGGTGAGKTVTLNALSNFIDPHDRILTLEDIAELQLEHDHVEAYEARPGALDGRGAIPIRLLLKNALRKRPDCIIVGECRGEETLDMLQALNTGHYGFSTGHANSPRELMQRLPVMVWMAGVDWSPIAVARQISSAIAFVVQIKRMRDGSRKVTQIAEILGLGREGAHAAGTEHQKDLGDDYIYMQDIYRFEETGTDENQAVLGQWKLGKRPKRIAELVRAGMNDLWMHEEDA